MSQLPMASTNARSPAPSLYKLVNTVPEDQRLRHPADALVIIGRQIELIIQNDRIPADVAIGTLRFSLFRLHQGRISQMAPFCRSLTVYGEADVEPPHIPGVDFVALPSGAPLCQEWFLVVDSPGFWGALLTRIVPERGDGRARRYLFEGALITDERTVNRANLLLNLMQQRSIAEIDERDPFINRARWARIAYDLATHSEAMRLNLMSSLNELPDLMELLSVHEIGSPTISLQDILPQSLQVIGRYDTAGAVLYKYENQQLQPTIWSTAQQPLTLGMQDGISGQALWQNAPVLTTLNAGDPEQSLFPEAHSVTAVPLTLHGQPWGVLTVGQFETDPYEAPAALSTIGVASLLEQVLMTSRVESPSAPPPASTSRPAAPTQPSPPPVSTNNVPQANRPMSAPPSPAPAAPPAPPAPSAPSAPPPASAGPAGASFGLPAWMTGGGAPAPAQLPGNAPAPAPSAVSADFGAQPEQDWSELQRTLMSALVAFDRRTAEYVWEDVSGKYTSEDICTELLMPVQVAVGEGWHRGEVSVAAEHFASRFVEGKMLGMLDEVSDNLSAPLAIIGCAQGEMHEIGAIMLALFMRWSGFRVIYLGQNVPNTTIPETIRQLRPKVLGLSATTVEAAHNLTETGQLIMRIEPPRPQFIFGGMAFYERPDLRSRIQGQFLEGDIRQITRDLAEQHRKA